MLRVATILDRNSKSPSPLNQGKSRARERWNAPLSYPWLWGEAGCEFSVYFAQDCRLFYSKVVEYHQPHYQGSHYSSLAPSDQSKRTLGTRFGYRASNAIDGGARLLASGAHHHLSAQGGKLTAGEPNNLQESAMKNWNSGPSCPKVDNSIHWINLYLVENIIGFPNTLDLFDE